jgi:hypothetical protein
MLCKIFLGKFFVIRDELDHFNEKFAKIVQIFMAQDGDGFKKIIPDPIRPKVPDPDLRHCRALLTTMSHPCFFYFILKSLKNGTKTSHLSLFCQTKQRGERPQRPVTIG